MIDLSSFNQPVRAAVIGASGGIGTAFVQHLQECEQVESICTFSRSKTTFSHPKVRNYQIDILDEDTIESAAKSVKTPLNLILVTTGILHEEAISPEKALKDLSLQNFEKIFAVNTFGPALIAKHFLPLIPKTERSVFAALSARVGSIEDNHLGGWYSYRASKAALNMIIKNTSIEISRRYKEACIIGLHPGTVDTKLSEPFQGNVEESKLFAPAYATEQMLKVVNSVQPSQSGKIFAYDGEVIPY